jgi:hypothetical protein
MVSFLLHFGQVIERSWMVTPESAITFPSPSKGFFGFLIIEGVVHNASFQAELLSTKEFVSGSYTTDYLEAYV